jgi:plasmid stability protein
MVCHNVSRKSSPEEPEQKDRVIHTRVPESLEVELRVRAERLGMSVSNLVRNVLGHAFGLVGDVVADSHAIARAAKGDGKPGREPEPEPAPEDILAWQAIVLGKNAVCSRCNALLAKGSEAAIGLAETGTRRAIICTVCFEGTKA